MPSIVPHPPRQLFGGTNDHLGKNGFNDIKIKNGANIKKKPDLKKLLILILFQIERLQYLVL
jgi:hypothetical protein